MGTLCPILLLLSTTTAQYIYPQYVQRPLMQQPQLYYYPVRTNCAPQCVPQTRYRLTYRPLVQPMVAVRPVNPMPGVALPGLPSQPLQPLPVVQQVTQPLPPITTPLPTPGPEITNPLPPVTTTTTELPTPPPEVVSTTIAEAPQPPTTRSTTTTTTTTTTTEEPTTRRAETTTTEAPSTLFPIRPSSFIPLRPSPSPSPSSFWTTTTSVLYPDSMRRPSRPGRPAPGEAGAFWRVNGPNPCDSGAPLKNDFGAPISCNILVEPNGGCPESHFCHPGVGFATTQCCPRTTEVLRCDQPRNLGVGRETTARWYYDIQSKQCKRFLYKGIKGNENNFITKTACMDACARHTGPEKKGAPEQKNPCRIGQVARNETTRAKIECGFHNGDACPSGYYCHVGIDADSTACCENSGISDPCLLSLNMGEGSEQIKRFFYDTLNKACTEFVYKGTMGNENNFLTAKECEKKCKKWSDPCPIHIGQLSVRKQCSLDGDECTKSEWCHVGHSPKTTVCCPDAVEDPCEQPLEVGEGGHNVTRWYADPEDKSCNRKCRPFQYGGTKGNQNNFITKTMCELKCTKKCSDPCGSGSLLFLSSGEPRQCSPLNPCPNTHWCHVGVTPQTTVCCSAVPDTCNLPLALGHGNSHLTRWRFDANKRKCVSFFYTGEGGNQNMFLTSEDCASVCPTYSNPCGSGKPLMIGTEPKVCSANENCPSTHFCHIGVDPTEQYCCPKSGDTCDQHVATGAGTFALERWYFDANSHRCEQFLYKGARGNANNFLTQADCEKECPVAPNPCRDGDPLIGEDGEPVICGGEQGCRPGYFCHVGASPDTTYCCPGTRRACDLMMEEGEGESKLERFFFDGTVQMCRAFTYKGLKGNANNFLSMAACREACKEANPCGTGEPFTNGEGERLLCTGGQRHDSCPANFYCHVGSNALTTVCCPKDGHDPCKAPREDGMGGENLPRYFFNSRTGRCTAFLYGGMGGNENNFISMATCRAVCPAYRDHCPHGLPLMEGEQLAACGVEDPCPSGHICHMNAEHNVSVCCKDPATFCTAARDPGPCTKTETRYGYDAETDSCVAYEYGGCGGTLNNFPSLQRCTQICCKEFAK